MTLTRATSLSSTLQHQTMILLTMPASRLNRWVLPNNAPFVSCQTPLSDAPCAAQLLSDVAFVRNCTICCAQAMGEIHAIKADGTVVKNIDVFARWAGPRIPT